MTDGARKAICDELEKLHIDCLRHMKHSEVGSPTMCWWSAMEVAMYRVYERVSAGEATIAEVQDVVKNFRKGDLGQVHAEVEMMLGRSGT